MIWTLYAHVAKAADSARWVKMGDETKPPKWTMFDAAGKAKPTARKTRSATRHSNEKSLRRNTLRL